MSEGEARLSALSLTLKSQLAQPRADSIVSVAGVHNALRALPASHVTPLRVECLLDVAGFFYLSGQTLLGLEPAANAVLLSAQLQDLALRRKALNFQGVLLADSGNLPAAIECYADALELARQQGDRFGECGVWNNLGVCLIYGAQFSDAIQCLEVPLRLAEGEPSLSQARLHALSNIALASLHSEDFGRGLAAAKESVEDGAEPVSASSLLSRVLSEANYTRLLLEVNNLDEAKRRCEFAKLYAAQACSQRAEQSAAIAEGLYEVYAGKVDIGLSRLQQSLERARIMKGFLRDALIALVKAYDITGKPQLALVHLRELLNVTRRTQQEKALLHHRLHLERLGGSVSMQAGLPSVEDLAAPAQIKRDRVRAQLALLHRQAIAAELVEDPSGEHVYRVGKLASLLAAEIGLDDDTCFMIEMSARLHDIGKIGIPDAILAKRGAINPEQRALIRTHANIGAELLSQSGLPHIQTAVDIARHHHESWDGSGYPDGIAGGAIPECARITTLADVFDVMTHARPYKTPVSPERALMDIRRMKGSRFDPELTERFVELVQRLLNEVGDLDEYLGREARDSPFIKARRKIAAALESARGGAIGGNGRNGGPPSFLKY